MAKIIPTDLVTVVPAPTDTAMFFDASDSNKAKKNTLQNRAQAILPGGNTDQLPE
jgi:hypothetical protein